MTLDKERYQGHWDAAYSDDERDYNFRRIPPGRYVLSVRYECMTSQQRPFPQTYHPGVGEKSQAAVITIKEGQRLEKYDLEVPPLTEGNDVSSWFAMANEKMVEGYQGAGQAFIPSLSYEIRYFSF